MPWTVQKSGKCPASKPWAVVKESDGSIEGCHATQAKAKKQQAALYANGETKMESKAEANAHPPKDNLIRAVFPGVELRASENGDGEDRPTMLGHFAVFNQWTEINSVFEGNFMERFAPGAFKKTLREQRDDLRVLFQHGRDPQIGDKPLGPIEDLREDDTGAYYEVPLLDAPYVRENILPGLEAGLYGASFRFRVLREEMVEEPKRSAHNPDGLPERTVKEAQVMEFGPVTFPAYKNASAGVRSLTDEFAFERLVRNPERLQELVRLFSKDEDEDRDQKKVEDAPPKDSAEAEPHPDHGSRVAIPIYGESRKEQPSWLL